VIKIQLCLRVTEICQIKSGFGSKMIFQDYQCAAIPILIEPVSVCKDLVEFYFGGGGGGAQIPRENSPQRLNDGIVRVIFSGKSVQRFSSLRTITRTSSHERSRKRQTTARPTANSRFVILTMELTSCQHFRD
jgi:hypothetical protein